MQEFTYTNEFLNPWLLGLDVLLLAHFGYSYYRYCLRLGYRLDFWHFTLMVGGVLPVLVNYLFAGASENKRFVGNALGGIQANIDNAFIIQIVGYICTYVGFYYYNLTRRGRSSAGVIQGFTAWTARLFRDFISTDGLIYSHVAFTMLVGLALIIVTFRGGLGFDLRARVFGDDSIRPIYNFCFQAEGPILLGAIWAKFLAEKKKSVLVCALLVLGMQLMSGARWPVVIPLGTLLSVYAVTNRHRIRFLTIGVAMVVLLVVALALQVLRSQTAPNEKKVSPVAELVYGNEYSDTRDFAWFLSRWDGNYVMGRTYLAGAMGFLPRALFLKEFRETWSYTFYQASVTGLDTAKHAGIRTGRYGEPYTNFGYFGVVLLGLLTGYLCRLIDDWIKTRAATGCSNVVTDFSITTAFAFSQPVYYSAASWTAYVMIVLLFSSFLLRTTRGSVRRMAEVAS